MARILGIQHAEMCRAFDLRHQINEPSEVAGNVWRFILVCKSVMEEGTR
jgi:hypothetical protein